MTRGEARTVARRLVKAGVENVRVVEWLDDGDFTLLVQRNNVALDTEDDVATYMQRRSA